MLQLPEEVELVWDDSVAPELCIDFDAPDTSLKDVLIAFAIAAGLLCLDSVYGKILWSKTLWLLADM